MFNVAQAIACEALYQQWKHTFRFRNESKGMTRKRFINLGLAEGYLLSYIDVASLGLL